uniref:Uncharacterized protein n=1 Tax=Oryza glumipatula TaxID=40148 RepID=A0A0D9Y689_9ORYZ
MENLPPHNNHAHHRSAPLTGNLHHCHHPRPTGAIGACLADCHRARPLPPSTSPPLRRSLEPGETHRAAPSLGRGLRRKPCRQPSGPAPSGDLLQRESPPSAKTRPSRAQGSSWTGYSLDRVLTVEIVYSTTAAVAVVDMWDRVHLSATATFSYLMYYSIKLTLVDSFRRTKISSLQP